ncbi:40S ribosomal protein S27 [Paracoccidioides brasiliensis Pb18]|uniref:40S ribosomal protein S27 n=1 Tax=Paracoccidioides brasiliensis (strain Pb18) TaxID=502780 RepID=C1GFL2_PARBD|nr:40S ribosomal protein S27 [Paracoccidioides brasiliensis Pb18]EEH49969.2 40S ribosomal protein S27 [Paracoccidioides brasiliensis Pb18]
MAFYTSRMLLNVVLLSSSPPSEILFIDPLNLLAPTVYLDKFIPQVIASTPSPSCQHGKLLSGRVLAVDLLNPTPQAEARKHKLKMLVPAPRSFFMDVKCPGCFTITTVFSHAQTVVICAGCSTVLCQPTGGKARLTEGCSFRRK